MTFNDQPHIEYPKQLAERGFMDYSYRNDLGARAFNEERKLSVWVREEKPEDRESEDWSRFEVCTSDEELQDIDSLFESESLDEVLAFLDKGEA